MSGVCGTDYPCFASDMISCLSHRGPDGQGYWSDSVNRVGNISFGHSRLAIIDVVGSSQPIQSEHGCVLIQNGEIYNQTQIRENTSYPWKTSGDGEAILAAHFNSIPSPSVIPETVSGKKNGWYRVSSGVNQALRHVEWVKRLNGMWGFALWDPRYRELILCRDELGIKP